MAEHSEEPASTKAKKAVSLTAGSIMGDLKVVSPRYSGGTVRDRCQIGELFRNYVGTEFGVHIIRLDGIQ